MDGLYCRLPPPGKKENKSTPALVNILTCLGSHTLDNQTKVPIRRPKALSVDVGFGSPSTK